MISKTDGAWVKFGFRGGRVRYITETAAQGACVDVYIDDVFVTSVDCFTNDTSRYDRNYVAFDSDDYDIEGLADINLNDGEFHVLKLVGHYDARNSKYSNSIFRVDAFDTYPDAAQVTATSDLLKLTAKAEALSEKMYTAESWERLRAALKNAETVFGNAASTEETVSVALKELQDAMDGLEETDMNIIAVTPLMLVEVPYEITAEELNSLLQQSVVVETAGGVKERVPVEWDLQKFDGNKAGTVTLKGELILDDNQVLQNIDGLEAEISVTVLKGEAQILLGNLEQTEGQVTPVTADTVPEGLEVSILYDGVATLPENAGSYQVTAEIIDNDYTGSAQGLLVIQAKEPENPGTDPEDPGVTDPDDPGVTDPEDPGVTDPDNPGATDPDDLGTGDPDDSDTTDSDKPGTIKPDKPGTGDNSGKNQNVGSTDTGDNWNSTVFCFNYSGIWNRNYCFRDNL